MNAFTFAAVANLLVSRRSAPPTLTTFANQTTTPRARDVRLTGISSGVRFAFAVTPYNGGERAHDDVTQSGTFRFVVGKLPVSVVAADQLPLAAVKVSPRRNCPTAGLGWIGSATTDSKGLVI